MAGTQEESDAAATPLVDYESRDRDRVFTRSGHYLIIGTLCGLCGAGYSVYITLIYRANGFDSNLNWSLNMQGEPFPSGNQYMPPSVSASVADTNSASGKVWLAFMVISSIMTMTSAYPFNYANVFVREDVSLFPCFAPRTFWPSMNTWRAYIAPIGIMIVAFGHAVSANLYDPAQNATIIVHTGGAVLYVGLPLFVEIYTLGWATYVSIGRQERQLRMICTILAVIFAVVYGFFANTSPEAFGVCCDDEWRNVTQADVDMANENGAYAIAQMNLKLMQYAKFQPSSPPINQGLYDTAHGMGLVWICVGFFGEIGAGVFLLLDVIVIWWFGKPLAVDDSTAE